MKTSIKLVLIYFVMQLLAALTAGPLTALYVLIVYGELDVELANRLSVAPMMLIGFLYMAAYLWRKGYLDEWQDRFAVRGLRDVVWPLVGGVGGIVLVSGVSAWLSFLPDWMEQTFDVLQQGVLGVLCMVLLGPLLEELLFRGAIMQELLRRYRPWEAILLSGLLFGVTHINPAQVVAGCLMGVVLGWIYWKTRSLLPCVLVHVLNNGLAVWMSVRWPEARQVTDLPGMSTPVVIGMMIVAAGMLGTALYVMKKEE